MKKMVIIFSIIFISFFIFSSEYLEILKNNLKGKKSIEQIILLEKYIAADNKNIALYILKAEIEIKNLDFIGGRDTLLSAFKIDNSNIQVLNLLGLCYFHLNKSVEAFKYFQKVQEIDKTNQLALYYMTLINPLNSDQNNSKKDEKVLTELNIRDLEQKYNQLGDNEKRDFVYLFNDRELIIKNEKAMDYSIHCVVKILNTQGINTFRNFLYSFNSYEYTPDVIKAGSYDSNYIFNEVNKKNIIFTDKKNDSDASIYTNRKYIAFPIPDLKVGTVIEYNIKFNSTGKNLSTNLFDQYIFGGFDKSINTQYIIQYPSNLKINILTKGSGFTVNDKREGNIIERKYNYDNPPAYNFNIDTVSIYDVAPLVMVSTFPGWDYISKWYSDIFENAIKKGFNTAEINNSLNLSKKTKFEKLNSIYQYIQQNIHYIAIELAESAMIPHSPDEIYKNKFGDCKDQAILSVYLLRSNNIEAYPVLLSTLDNGPVDKRIPSPFFFNHVITYVPKQDGISEDLFLDTTSSLTTIGNLPSLDQGTTGFIIKKDSAGVFTDIPVISYDKNVIEENYIIETNIVGGGKIGFTNLNKGTFSEIMRYSLRNKSKNEIIDYYYNRNKQSFLNLKKENLSVEGIEKQSGDILIKINSDENTIANIFYDGRQKINFQIKEINSMINILENPKYDIKQNFIFTYKKKVDYKFPDDYKITDGEIKNLRKENDYMTYEFNADQISDNHFIFYFQFVFKKRIIKKEDISNVNQFLASIEKDINFELTIENKKSFNEEKFYEELVKVYNKKEIYENYVRKLLEKRNNDKALEICSNGIKFFPEDIFFYLIKSTILMDQKKTNEAESLLLDALTIDKTNPDIYLYLAELYRLSKDDKKAEAILIDANKKFNDNNLMQALITFYKRNALFDKGIEFVKDLITKQSDNSSFFSELGYFYSIKKDLPNAEQSFLKAINLNPKNALSMNNLAWLYCENEVKIKNAIEYAKKACEIDMYNDSFLDTLAEAYFKNKDYDLAIETINKAIKINPNYTYLQIQLDKIEKAKKLKTENK